MANQPIRKKLLKRGGIFLGSILLLLGGFHIWFTIHAKEILEELVESQSNGRLKLKVKKFSFGYFSNKLELEKAVFYNTDTLTTNTGYRFSVDKIHLQVYALWPIIFKKQFLIDSLTLSSPDIVITKLRISDKPDPKEKKDLSIPEEMGKVYHSIQDALQVLKVRRFEIENAKLTLLNKVDPTEKPIIISNLFFHLDNLQIDTAKLTGNEKFLFGENLVLRTRNQDILFPDGRHRLSFDRFRINMRKKLVEFDSCTIAATKGDSSGASFKVFFDALLLTNIDFDTLYRAEVIKADSVYCLNPQFILDVGSVKSSDRKKPPPKLDEIIQQLTGNMELGFVIVNNGSFNITSVRDGQPSSFTSEKNNFEMQGFSVDKDAAQPIKVKSFAMAIRNFENFLRDSSISVQFDSILFNNNRMFLSNFRIHQFIDGKLGNRFSMPQFELRGMVWDELVFNRRLRAKGATLYRPLIDFTASKALRKRRPLFETLAGIDRVVELEELNIVDGQISLVLKNGTQLQMEDATLTVDSKSLFGSNNFPRLGRSVHDLAFSHGWLKTSKFTAELDNVKYRADSGSFSVKKLMLFNKSKSLVANGKNVYLKNMVREDSSGHIIVNGLSWEQADLKISVGPKGGGTNKEWISVDGISGNNTSINANVGGTNFSSQLKHVSLSSLTKLTGKKWEAKRLIGEGNDLSILGKNSQLTIDQYKIVDGQASRFQNIKFRNLAGPDSIRVSIPFLTTTPDISSIMDGDYIMNDLSITSPAIFVAMNRSLARGPDEKPSMPKIRIGQFKITNPDIHFTAVGDSSMQTFQWNGTTSPDGNFLEGTNLSAGQGKTSSFKLDKLRFLLNDFTYGGARGKVFSTGDGSIRAELEDMSARQDENKHWNWSATLGSLKAANFLFDSLGKKAGKFSIRTAEVEKLLVSSLNEPVTWLAKSPGFKMKNLTGEFMNSDNYFGWGNAVYDANSRTFSADSFSYHPTLDREAYVASHRYQTDDLRVNTGKITVELVDPGKYLEDSIVRIHSIHIDKVDLDDFRDKHLPFNAGVIKLLPVKMIQKIPFKLTIDSILLDNTRVVYSELDSKSNETGTIPVTRMFVRIFPVRNFDLTESDSLRIQANGYLMDSIWVRLRVRESYLDSLGGFFLTVRMKPAGLDVLNPILTPLSYVKVQSGYLDTLSLRAVGREYLAYGEMKMNYHNLKVKFLKNGDETKKSFLSGLITFVVNSFVVRNNNKSRIGKVFFIRLRDRSIMNYLVKITMSGVASSVGAKGNRKVYRQYKKELRQRNLPPVDYD